MHASIENARKLIIIYFTSNNYAQKGIYNVGNQDKTKENVKILKKNK